MPKPYRRWHQLSTAEDSVGEAGWECLQVFEAVEGTKLECGIIITNVAVCV